MEPVTIIGAGLSGLVAAINLVRQGYEVLVLEDQKQIGGSPMFHPSLHATPIDIGYTSDFVGIDVSHHFTLLTDRNTWIMDKRIYPKNNSYGVERGNRESSIDTFMFEQAKELGVKFEFGHTVKSLAEVPPGSIVATGLNRIIRDLDSHKAETVHGFSFRMESGRDPSVWHFTDMYSPDYFYALAMNGMIYGLLFGRRTKIEKKWLNVVGQQFYERAGIEINDWEPFICHVMKSHNLFAGPGNRYILTGTASGTIDPFYGFGIVGALTSGKIAAMAVYDPEGALALFSEVNRNFKYSYYLFELLSLVPRRLKWGLFKKMLNKKKKTKLNPIFERAGNGIPGYPRNFMAESYDKKCNMAIEKR